MSTLWKNPDIAVARDAALEILRPSPAQLQHGLALHEQATVVETYGFSAFAAPDARVVQRLIDQNAGALACRRRLLESRMTRMAVDAHQRELFDEAWRAAGVTCVLRNSGEEGNDVERLLERLSYNTRVTDQLPQLMRRMTTAEHIQQAAADDRYGFLLVTNGVPLPPLNQSPIDAVRCIGVFFGLGVRMMHLTYNRRNPIGDGCAETRDGGLSDFGRSVVAEMNRVGVIVDGAHSSLQTCLDAAACSARPVVISHATCAALNPHCRAKTDQVMRAVADTGGLMGICCIPAFLGGSGDIRAFLDHIDHAVKVMGVDHVGIGTDVSLALPPSPDDPPVPALPAAIDKWESHWPPNDALFDPKWRQPHMTRSMAWTNWPLFTVGLVQRGYTDEQIAKILGGNMLRVLRAVMAAA